MTAGTRVLQFAATILLALVLVGCSVLSGGYEPESAAAQPPVVPGTSPDPTAPRLAPLPTTHFTDVAPGQQIVGDVQVLFSRYENTFVQIARRYNIGYEALRQANPGVDQWLPGEETPVYLPTMNILPRAPRAGIVINLPSMRLLYFVAAGDGATETTYAVTSHPIGIGREGWATPLGQASVTQKARDPTWYPPASVRAEHAAAGDPLPSIVPPGPDNPLGRFAIGLSLPGYLIHGTNKPAGVGMRVSHGCIRLYPEDIEALFDRVAPGTPVHIVDQPVLAGWRDGQLYLEAHRPLAEDQRDPGALAEQEILGALEGSGVDASAVDWSLVAAIVEQPRGMPFPVLLAASAPEEYLASARIVENLVPVSTADATASR